MKPNPNCPRCKGKGWVLVQISEFDVEKDVCDCVTVGPEDEVSHESR